MICVRKMGAGQSGPADPSFRFSIGDSPLIIRCAKALEVSPKQQVRSTLTGRNQASLTPLGELGADLAIPTWEPPVRR
jgi:hypothetical protein